MNIKTLLMMGILSMFGLGSCANAQKQNDAAAQELHYTMNDSLPKNCYQLTMSSNGCNFRVLVNDVPVFGYWESGGYTGSYPINNFILKSGTQRLKVQLYPAFKHEDLGINSEEPLYLEIKKQLDGQDLDDDVAVLTNPIPKVQKGIPYYEYECTFEAEVPYEITELEDLADLTKEPDIEKQAVAKYNEMKSLYEKGQYNKFQEQFKLRDKRIEISHYFNEEQNKQMVDDDMKQMKEDFKKVAPIENYNLKFYGNNKLILLEDSVDFDYLFRLEDKGNNTIWPIPFYLGKRKGSDKLEIVF